MGSKKMSSEFQVDQEENEGDEGLNSNSHVRLDQLHEENMGPHAQTVSDAFTAGEFPMQEEGIFKEVFFSKNEGDKVVKKSLCDLPFIPSDVGGGGSEGS
ncbi:hypothetical protein Hanom_Chr15g01382401 [Helianthus anomalus]